MEKLILPEAFEDGMRVSLGLSFDEFRASLQTTAPTSIRVNPSKMVDCVETSSIVPWSRYGHYLSARPVFTLDPLFHAGAYYVQEASSMFVEQAVLQSIDSSVEINALDLCAAPGGKTTHLLSLLNNKSLVIANEVIRSRANILAENVCKWGYANVIVTNSDPEHFQSLQSFFDLIVVDAPCSGEGLFRKDPKAVHEWSQKHVELCARRQRRILQDVWPSLKEEGILIYCTCTYNELENEENLKWLQETQEIEFVPLSLDKTWGIETSDEHGVKGYRFYPHYVNGEGFFLSVIKKKGRVQPLPSKRKKASLAKVNRLPDEARDWLKDAQQFDFFQHGDIVRFFPADKMNELESIVSHLNIVSAGTAFATIKHKKTVPDHALAMSTAINKDIFNKLDLSEADALDYLRKNTLQIRQPSPGLALITFQLLPLGWANVLPNRVNNLYPSDWRIRMS